MVGIARARGCGTCRKRKIACGLERPSCAQCIKSNRTCTGYRKYPIFIAHQPPKGEDSTRPGHGESTLDSTIHTHDSQRTPVDFNGLTSSSSSNGNHLDPVQSIIRLGAQVNANPALRQRLLGQYLDNHLSKNRLGPMQQRVWLIQIPKLPDLTPALEVSMMALAVAKLGEVYSDEGLIHESLKLYREALHEVQLALWDRDLMLHDQTLTACVALGIGTHGWIGTFSLCTFQDPGHSLFSGPRRASFLGEPLWQEVPWRVRPKTPYDRIYDFLTCAPDLRRQGEMLEHMDPLGKLQLATEMIRKCWKLDAELQSVYDCLEKSHDGPLYWPELARDKSLDLCSNDGMLFPVAFHFPDLSIANTIIIYWGVQAMLWQGLWLLYGVMTELQMNFAEAGAFAQGDADSGSRSLTNTVDNIFHFPPLEHRADFAAPCRNILQSVEYSLQGDMLDQGPKCVAAPLRMAIETMVPFPQYRREVAWGERAVKKVQERSLRLLIYYTPRR
ncbi:Fungal Zn2-Cys6 binuclear cluster domain-containing protein [Cladophialophora immunda]|nr:Fungal Zn2-Cys6 binuclear cluster domain-containing protein [Cladophialophora immunda]